MTPNAVSPVPITITGMGLPLRCILEGVWFLDLFIMNNYSCIKHARLFARLEGVVRAKEAEGELAPDQRPRRCHRQADTAQLV